MDLTAALVEAGVLPVVTVTRAGQAVPLAQALLAGGLDVEITFRSDAAVEAIRAIRAGVPEMLVGAGTVLTTAQADAAIEAGASFLVSPGFGPDVVDDALARGVPMLPGIATPTELAFRLRCDGPAGRQGLPGRGARRARVPAGPGRRPTR